VLTDGASRQESGVEWYDFPPTYGSYLRIIGHGNTRTPWTSILEVQFGSAPPARVALQ